MIKKLKLGIVTQAGSSSGYGHIHRTIAIANQLKKNYQISIFLIQTKKKFTEIINNNFKIIKYKKNIKIENLDLLIIDKLNNNSFFIKNLSQNNAKIIIFDDKNYYKQKNIFQINVLYFSKKNRNLIPFIKSKSIPHIITKKYNYQYKFNNNVKKILFIQGGGDPHGNLLKIYKLLSFEFIKRKNIKFVFHLGYNSKDYYKINKNNIPNNVLITSSKNNFYSIIKDVDLAITSVGLTALDFVYYKIPCIYLSNEKKELETSLLLSKNGIGYNFGKLLNSKKKLFLNVINKYINKNDERKKLYIAINKYKVNGLEYIKKIIYEKI
tara:strand:+ start:5263 stop:6234 length:972 start_codon:yes stop_codon:yes gene_type:complete